MVRLGPCAQLYSLRHRTVQIFVFLEILLLAQVLQLPTRTPDFNRIVVRDGDQHFRITRVERHGVDNIVMRVFDEACSIVAVPKVAILVLGSTTTVEEFNFTLFKFINMYQIPGNVFVANIKKYEETFVIRGVGFVRSQHCADFSQGG